MNHPPIDSISAEAIDLAAAWHERSLELLTLKERAIQGRLKGLLNNPIDKVMMVKMIDRSFRSGDAARTAEQINDLFRQYGIPGFFSGLDTVLIRLFLGVGRFFPRLVVPLVIGKMRKDSSHTIVQGESGVLGVLLRKRKKEGVRMNLNHLGEAVLGEEEALSRLEIYLQDLKNPWIECISVKISTIYSQIVSLAFEHTVDILTERLSRLYRTAKSHRFVRRDGTRVPKMVNLDMEEYRDLEITDEAFRRTLDRAEFRDYSAGIALQAYLPDAYSHVRVARFTLAEEDDVRTAAAIAREDPDGWRSKSWEERHRVLSRVARELRLVRGDLIGAAAANTGKVFTEADVEVSEAVDFAEYYPHTVKTFTGLENLECRGKGSAVVVSPWNFPIAIPCGGIVASLASGNCVVFKPSSEAVLVAWLLCRCFWEAGVSKNALQFLPCSGATTGRILSSHPDIDFVILTGSTDTGLDILKRTPDILLAAETGGKNATIVTSLADRDQAISNAVYSAFGNCGQKCSATSLLILEKEIYESAEFREQLVDAARSFRVGSAWDFENKMGPLIHPPTDDLERALTRLEPGESWALKPRNLGDNPYMWSAGVKWDVQPESYTHMTEFFGPVLGVMCARDLDHAIDLANRTGYGLTSGLESLDEGEQQRWKAGLKAGNLYINRGTTGAITQRQPFGGMGKSALGPGMKAGGPNYVSQFMRFEESGFPSVTSVRNEHSLLRLAQRWKLKSEWGRFAEFKADIDRTIRAVKSYLYHAEREFLVEKDTAHLRGQDNVHRYLPIGTMVVRVHQDDDLFDVSARIAAARTAGCRLRISIPPGLKNAATDFLEYREGKALANGTEIEYQTDSELVASIPHIQGIRYAAPDRVPDEVFRASAHSGFYISREKVMMEGRIELLQYFQNQTVSHSYHRYGNLGERSI